MNRIDQMYSHRISRAYAQSTMNNFRSECLAYFNFAKAHRLQIFPPVYKNVARYLTVMAEKVTAIGTMTNKLSAISKMYALCDYNFDSNNPTVDLLIKSCRREMSTSSRPKAPLEPGHILRIANCVDFSVLTHRLFYIALVVQFFACLRKSNLLPTSTKNFSQSKHLTRGDFHFVPGAMILSLSWTKTIQNNQEIVTLPIADIPDAVINPVAVVKQLFTAFPLPSKMPAFALPHHNKLIVLTQQVYGELLKLYLQKVGVNPDAFTTHSVRKGSASTMFHSGLSQQHIKMHGTWKSSCFERYITANHADRLLPSQKMVRYINTLFGDSH